MRNYYELLALSDEELAKVDPVEMNLLVGKSIPSLAGLEIGRYQQRLDEWTSEVRERLPRADLLFRKNPGYWKNDLNFIRLAIPFEYLDRAAGVRYKEEQANATSVHYTDPSDLFLNGVMDKRRGTCASMMVLYMAITWRLGWPVSIACARAHYLCRYDDGRARYNVEASRIGLGGFASPEDADYVRWYHLTPRAVSSGSDLRALKPREVLGVFVGFRARHMQDSGNVAEAEKDYLLARHLFPTNHQLYFKAMGTHILRANQMFAPHEEGTPLYWADCINVLFRRNRLIAQTTATVPEVIAGPSVIDVGYTIDL